MLESGQLTSVNDLPAAELDAAVLEALKAAAEQYQLELVEPKDEVKTTTTFPFGVLATDHTGYLSFDLRRMPREVTASVLEAIEVLRQDPDATVPAAIWVYPFSPTLQRYDALRQRRFADDAIVMRLELEPFELPSIIRHLGLPALQNPSLTDWRLSPGSFAAQAGALLGDDGCEHIFPANLALHGFNFHQVISLTDPGVHPPVNADVAARLKVGFVNEYRLTWYPIGHSLGQILHSFPLAPGESVNLAIIDWSRQDAAMRTEETKLDESLFHTLRRDRVVTETVNAAIDEWQRGGSIMGGTASSAGGAAGTGYMGLAAGVSSALGGAYSTSSGSRDIAATTMQKLADNIVQSSTASRELRSTVVVQTNQAEKEAIETRTIVNYNHSHALTILYYEVLRHFRIVMEFARRRPVVLTNIHGGITYQYSAGGGGLQTGIYWPTILENRKVIQDALIDSRYAGHLDMLERRQQRERIAEVLGPPPP
ncbi:hypothetical protein, partial [Mesorhizobium sp.]|uniref:hypothetical protein n=1 Tax=Mesorhizobium sp. TaxID=1871066 RepID=UPI0011F87FC0